MTITPKILFIEDEPEYVSQVAATAGLIAPDIQLVTAGGADSAVAILDSRPVHRFHGVILDIAMNPGDIFAKEDTKGSMRTGVLLYKRLAKWIDLMDNQGVTLPVAVHTHIADDWLRIELEDLHRAIGFKLPIRFFYKPTIISEFIKDVTAWFAEF